MLCVLAITLMVVLFALATDIPLLSPYAPGQPAIRGAFDAVGTASDSVRGGPEGAGIGWMRGRVWRHRVHSAARCGGRAR